MGSALALGVMPMVVSDPGSTMPFDLDVKPVSFNGDLSDALDRVLYSIPQVSGGSSLRETLQELLARCHSSDATTSVTARALANTDLRDSVEGVNGMELLASVNGDGRWGLLRPVWPGAYPALRQRRCFHVMPFGQPWSDGVRDAVCAACGDVAVYVRGDETGDPCIIPSICKEIGMATHVVVDMTGMNENVCLELALAQALGKKILLTMQSHEGSIRNLFPEVAKLQIRQYTNETKLAAEVRNFVLV